MRDNLKIINLKEKEYLIIKNLVLKENGKMDNLVRVSLKMIRILIT